MVSYFKLVVWNLDEKQANTLIKIVNDLDDVKVSLSEQSYGRFKGNVKSDKIKNKGVKVVCQRCGHKWNYTGSNPYYTCCPYCKSSNKIPKKEED